MNYKELKDMIWSMEYKGIFTISQKNKLEELLKNARVINKKDATNYATRQILRGQEPCYIWRGEEKIGFRYGLTVVEVDDFYKSVDISIVGSFHMEMIYTPYEAMKYILEDIIHDKRKGNRNGN